ncbi:hypothetical protein D088_280008 [Salmonella enterica subsp. houtenae serovar 16:z4,z32:-- str. RKS3027]|nr:hypothetical protein D088_280008 [Salmonella enterica subsp. houtenae serovar 16:z4,z32:-- str. RKS3027]
MQNNCSSLAMLFDATARKYYGWIKGVTRRDTKRNKYL